jgi:hypothetical protein
MALSAMLSVSVLHIKPSWDIFLALTFLLCAPPTVPSRHHDPFVTNQAAPSFPRLIQLICLIHPSHQHEQKSLIIRPSFYQQPRSFCHHLCDVVLVLLSSISGLQVTYLRRSDCNAEMEQEYAVGHRAIITAITYCLHMCKNRSVGSSTVLCSQQTIK